MAVPMLKTKRKYGKSGIANVSQKNDMWVLRFEEDGTVINVMTEDAPEWMRKGTCNISLDEFNTKVMSIRPPAGVYFGKFKGFWAKEGEEPIYREKAYQPKTDRRDWDIPAHLEFTALFTIIDNKDWDGFQISKSYAYPFVEYPDTEIAALTGWGSKKMEGLLNVLGFDLMNDSIPYTENVLPWLQEELVKLDTKLVLTCAKGGWLNKVTASPV